MSQRTTVFWSGHLRREYQLVLDLAWLATALVVSYLLRFEFWLPGPHRLGLLVQLPIVVLVQFLCLHFLGVYSFVWRYVGMAEVQAFVRAAFYSTLPILLLRLGLPPRFQEWKTPLSIILMDAALAFGGLLALRVLRRWLYERYERTRRQERAGTQTLRRVLLVGAGRAGVLAAREILGRGDLDILPVAFVDDDPAKQGAVIHGLKVLGETREIPRLARDLDIDHAIITIANAEASVIRGIAEICEKSGVRVRIIPGLYEILGGQVSLSRIRDLQIEDLLGRAPVDLDEASMRRFVAGRTVLVTGAGGSIGSELVVQLLHFGPAELILVERSEGALFEVDRRLREKGVETPIVPVLADAGDGTAMRNLLSERGVQVVLHAAAFKHVP
ncbi:MAG: polysaccharide biosynthesis protein, partial [Thermoanaerobaculia bacterium]|nr:polysaccharide biosynthesis protein [Thermoanaerobaculia bacterium]